MAHCDQTVQEILFFFGVGLMDNTLVAVAGGAGLIGVDSRNQDQAVGYLVVDLCKTVDIIADRIFVICRAGTDDNQQLVAFAGEDIADLGIAFLLDRNQRIRNRILLPDFIGSRKFSDIIETHDFSPSQTVLMKHHSLSGCIFMQNGSVFHYSIGKTQAQANFIISYQFPCSFFMGRFHARMKICLRKATEGAPLYEQK